VWHADNRDRVTLFVEVNGERLYFDVSAGLDYGNGVIADTP
jgi:hypothetical protein